MHRPLADVYLPPFLLLKFCLFSLVAAFHPLELAGRGVSTARGAWRQEVHPPSTSRQSRRTGAASHSTTSGSALIARKRTSFV